MARGAKARGNDNAVQWWQAAVVEIFVISVFF